MTSHAGARIAASIIFGLVVLAFAWSLSTLIGLPAESLHSLRALAPLIAIVVWAYVVNEVQAGDARSYLLAVGRYRPMMLAFAMFLALLLVWSLVRSIVGWSIERNTYDYGPCSLYSPSLDCGVGDFASRRADAIKVADDVACVLFLMMPMLLFIPRIRHVLKRDD